MHGLQRSLSILNNWVSFEMTFRGSFDGISKTLIGGFDISEFFLQVFALLFTFLIGCLKKFKCDVFRMRHSIQCVVVRQVVCSIRNFEPYKLTLRFSRFCSRRAISARFSFFSFSSHAFETVWVSTTDYLKEANCNWKPRLRKVSLFVTNILFSHQNNDVTKITEYCLKFKSDS